MITTTIDHVLAGGPLGGLSIINGYITQKAREARMITNVEDSDDMIVGILTASGKRASSGVWKRVILRTLNVRDRVYKRPRTTQVTAFRWYERAYLSGKESWRNSEKSLADLELILNGKL